MDERDFAELISVFLKSNEAEKNSHSKETGTPETPVESESPSNEAEVRKNIIEALAERIRESQETELQPADISTVQAKPEAEAEPAAPAIAQPEEAPAIGEMPQDELTDAEHLITKEEVDQLLNKEEPAEIVTLQQILHRFTDLDGVIAALLVTRDGFIVDYASNIEFELDMVSAIIATGFSTLDRIGYELEQGALQLAMIEYEQGPVVIAPLVQDIALIVVASQWTPLGRIRWEIKKQGDELVANL